MAQGWNLLPTLFLVYMNGLLREIDKFLMLGVKFSESTLSGLLFADDFVGLAETGSALQKLIEVHNIVNVGILKPM